MQTLPDVIDRTACAALDRDDETSPFRERFEVDDDLIYLDGNSLGRLPRATASRVAALVQHEWGRGLVRSWTDADWMNSPQRVGAKIARLIGAADDEVLVTETTSVLLFKLVMAALQMQAPRSVILTDEANFPTDLYIAESVASLVPGACVVRVPRSALLKSMDADVALVLLTHVDFRSGEMLDMRGVNDAARSCGALAVWDLSHSTGAVSLDMHESGTGIATGCGYKYLNGGPGAPAYAYVSKGLQGRLRNPVRGWLAHATPFTFEAEFRSAGGMRAWMSGSPPVIATAALEVAIDLFLEADMRRLGAKSAALTDLFIRLADARLARHGFEVVTPRDAARRGAQVALRHAQGFPIVLALIAAGVIGDFREPDLCRFGLAPIYTRYVDVWDAIDRMAGVMERDVWRRPEFAKRGFIT